MHYRWSERARPLPGRHPAGRGDRPHPRRAEGRSAGGGSRSARTGCSCAATGSSTIAPATTPRAATCDLLGWLEPILTERPFMLGEPADDRRHRADGPVLAPLRPRPDPGAADAGPRPGGVRVGGADLERAREPDRRPRRSPTASRPTGGRSCGEIGETHLEALAANAAAYDARREGARPHGPGHDLPRDPDQRLPAVVPATAPGARYEELPAGSGRGRARAASSATAAGSRCGGSPTFACDHDPRGHGAVLPRDADGARLAS